MRSVKGDLDASGLHVGIAVAEWNEAITSRLSDAAVARCEELGAEEVTVLSVPGALELPLGCQVLADSGCDAVVAIGTVVKGDTDHYDIVVRESSAGISNVSLKTGVPVGNAILAVHDYEQAVERSHPGPSNKGVEAADAVISLTNGIRGLG